MAAGDSGLKGGLDRASGRDALLAKGRKSVNRHPRHGGHDRDRGQRRAMKIEDRSRHAVDAFEPLGVVDGVAAGADISAENGSLNDDGNDGTDNADAGYDAYAEVVS